MEALDAQSGKRVVAVATYNIGMPWNVLGYYQAYGHARRAFELAAGLLREQLHPGAAAVFSADPGPFADDDHDVPAVCVLDPGGDLFRAPDRGQG